MSDRARGLAFIDISGVGNSGKSAAADLLREFDGIFSPHFQFEFDLLRVRGGLSDLRHALVEDWSPVRSHAALLDFLAVARRMGVDPRGWWDFSAWLHSTSQRYDAAFGGRFLDLTQEFAASFVAGSYKAEWPYDDLRISTWLVLARKVVRRLGGRGRLLRRVLLVDGSEFDSRAHSYLSALFAPLMPPGCAGVVLNNGFEPFNPRPFLDMLPGSRQVVVTRDPRDVYVSGLSHRDATAADRALLGFDNDGLNKSFLASDDVALFIRRYRLYHRNLPEAADRRVLRLQFEDLVRDYDRCVAALADFVGVAPSAHARPRAFFDPARSAKNVGVWRASSKQAEIRRIEEDLGEYLVEG